MESTDNLHTKSNGDLSAGNQKQHSTGTRLLMFLVLLFALTTVAMSVIMAVTILNTVDKDNANTPTNTAPAPTAAIAGGPSPMVTTAAPVADDVCLTEGCVIAAARVRTAIDDSVNPCDNFFDYACGSWIRQHVIPEDKGSFGTFTKLRDDVAVIAKYLLEAEETDTEPEVVKKLKKYYRGCVNTEILETHGLDLIQEFMEKLGGWPLLYDSPGGKWDERSFTIKDLFINVRKGTNSPPLLEFYVSQDDKNPTKHILAIDQPSLGMPSRDYMLKARNDTMLMAYQNLWKNMAVAFGATESAASGAAKKVVDFEIEIANITVPKEERRDANKLYNLMTIKEMKGNYTGFDWLGFMNRVMEVVNITLTEDEPVIVVAPDYFEKLFSLLKMTDNRTIADYVVGRRVLGKTFYLPERFRDISLEYSKVLTGTANRPPRWQSCTGGAEDVMPQVLGRMFVHEAFHEDAKQDVLKMIDNLKIAFKEMLGHIQWMDDDTKQIAREKADAVEPRIGYPDQVDNITLLTRRYENLTIDEEHPMRTLINISDDNVYKNLINLRKDYDRTSWGMSPATVNAYYSPSTNQITFPAAILQPPFYTKSQPSYLNYGGIGYVIGHELTHGFDDQGRRYDKEGHLKQWWSQEAIDKFKVQAQCIIDQYGNFTVPGTGGEHLNGITTLGENIADNGGIKESFLAYRKLIEKQGKEEPRLPGLSYNPNQLFFLNAAQVWCENMRDKEKVRRIRTDPHSLDVFRVLGPLQNFAEFSKAFNCPKTSYMNKQQRCEVW